uniref:Myb-like domain-containing protein n=1 Tax=Brassica oleracea var. oleracea TaxID=109376 RepID=A0A0D3BW63_BRAOL
MSGYRHLLYSQMPVDLESPEPFWLGSQAPDDSPSEIPPECPSQIPPECPSQVPGQSRMQVPNRRKYSPKEDRILIGAWLNTSKDPLVGNEQRAVAFWKRIVDYYNASPQLIGEVPREVTSCRQRWSRINHELLTTYSSPSTIPSSHSITAEERHEQKWASTYMAKDGGKEKRRPVVDLDGPEENVVGEDEDRPVGVKAAKGASKKKKSGRDEELSKLQGVLELKEKLSRNKLLDRLLAKKEPLSEIETTLKMKLMSEML